MDVNPEQYRSMKEKIDQVLDLAKNIQGLNLSVITKLQSLTTENYHQIRSIVGATKMLLDAIEESINTGKDILEKVLLYMAGENIGPIGSKRSATAPEARVDSFFSLKLPCLPSNTPQQSAEWRLPQVTPKLPSSVLPSKPSSKDISFAKEQHSTDCWSMESKSTTGDLESYNSRLSDLVSHRFPHFSAKCLQANSDGTNDSAFEGWLGRYIPEDEDVLEKLLKECLGTLFKEFVYGLSQHANDIDFGMYTEGDEVSLFCLEESDIDFDLNQYTDEIDREVERIRRSATRPTRGTGPDTILCLDISESMRGDDLQRMISAVHKITDGVEAGAKYEEIQENIAVVTFGADTKVALHLTNDYQQVRRVVDAVSLGGPSPILHGLMNCITAILGNESAVKLNEVSLEARVIVVTDGKFSFKYEKEEIETANIINNLMSNALISMMGKFFKMNGHVCYCVSTGNERSNMLSTALVDVTKGKTVSHDDVDELAFMSKYLLAATRLLYQCPDLVYGDRKDASDERAALNALLELECIAGQDEFELRESEKNLIVDLAMDISWRPSTTMNEPLDYNMREIDPLLPNIGSRVRRGRDWRYGLQDGNGPGTVVGQNADGTVAVIWDSGVMTCTYRCKELCDIRLVEYGDDRILRDDELINIGCKVVRGPCWNSGDEDGGPGSIGVVCRCTRNGVVAVRWPNKTIQHYRFGEAVCLALSSGGLHAINNDSNLQNIKSTKPIQKVSSSYERRGGNDSNRHFFQSHNLMSGSHSIERKLSTDSEVYQLPMIKCRDPALDREIPVIWSYKDNTSNKWREFDIENMRKLEADFKKNQKTTVLQMDTKDFRVVYAKMTMLETKGKQHENRTEIYLNREPKEHHNCDDVFT